MDGAEVPAGTAPDASDAAVPASGAAARLVPGLTLLLSVYALLIHRFWFVCDDAFISFRYARHWASGAGLRFNPGAEAPVEGYSNFLWVVVATAVEALGADVTFWAPLLSALCGGLLLQRVHAVGRGPLGLAEGPAFLAALALAGFVPFAVWATSGLETMPFALALFLAFELLVLHESRRAVWGAAGAMLAAALLRPEGIVWLPGIAACAALRRGLRRRPWRRPVALFLALVLAAFALYFAWRLAHFGHWLPNTVQAKAGLSAASLERGLGYVTVFGLSFLSPFLLFVSAPVALRRAVRPEGLALSVAAFAPYVYAVAAGGDFMAMGRFLVPSFAFTALLFGLLLDWIGHASRSRRVVAAGLSVCVLATGLMPGWDLHLVPEALRSEFHFRRRTHRSEYQQWRYMKQNAEAWGRMARALARHARAGESVVAGAVGSFGYYTELYVYDRFGLVDPDVSGRPALPAVRPPGHDRKVAASHFLDREPTYLAVKLFSNRHVERVRRQVANWHERFPHIYAPVLLPLADGDLLVVLERFDSQQSAAAARRAFELALEPASAAPRVGGS